MTSSKKHEIESFDFQPGRILASKFEVVSLLGKGWEGEVYMLKEVVTGIERAAKFFFPHRNLQDKTSITYARKLHRLRHCPMLIQYHTQETIRFKGKPISFLVSEYVEGEQLSDYVFRQPGKRMHVFEALHLLRSLTEGIKSIHEAHEYHGDLHTENIIVRKIGLGFQVKVIDMFHWGRTSPANFHDDICDLIRVFYDSLGGAKRYSKYGKEVKDICCGLKRSLILKKYRTAEKLLDHLNSIKWE